MMWIFALMILVINECASGEKWFCGVIRSFSAVCLLYKLAINFSGQMLALSVFGLAAVAAVELFEKDSLRQAAKKRFEDISAQLDRQPLVHTQRIDDAETKNDTHSVA